MTGKERARAVALYIQRENFILQPPSSMTSDTAYPEDATGEDFAAGAHAIADRLEHQARAYREFAVEAIKL